MAKPDGWDVSRWASAGIGVVGLIASQAAKKRNHKDAANIITGLATATRMGLEAATPPRCPACAARSVSTATAQGQWFCPNGHGAVNWKA